MTDDGEEVIRKAIAAGEPVANPLDGLVDRAAQNPGAAFEPAVLEAMASLRTADPAAYETLIAELRAKGVRVGQLERAMKTRVATRSPGALALIENTASIEEAPGPGDLDALNGIELFRAADDDGYAAFDVGGFREVARVSSMQFRDFLMNRLYDMFGELAPSEHVSRYVQLAEYRARFEGPSRDVRVRIAEHDGVTYIDLGDEHRRVVKITTESWQVVDTTQQLPVYFERPRGLKPLSEPARGGDIALLRPYLNVASDDDFVLLVLWLLSCFRARGPYPVLVLSGEQGSAKSTLTRLLRALIDPNAADLRARPRNESDLIIAASNAHVLAFDNLSGGLGWLSDALCRIATGGGYAARKLFTDRDEVIFHVCRPVILNGIEDFVSRQDLADRALFLQLLPIPDRSRRSEEEFWSAFEVDRPKILGALLDGVVRGLKLLPEVQLPSAPRMTDFARWATACETAYWAQGTFGAAYLANRTSAVNLVIEADPVASALRELMASVPRWEGTASELLELLQRGIDPASRRDRAWPANAAQLSARLKQIMPFLRRVGLDFGSRRQGHDRNRIIIITRLAEPNGSEDGA